jgi:ornithine--oxo-acid transaminase
MDLADAYGAHNYHPLPLVVARAQGAWVEDAAGRRYLDLLASYSALNQGHRHPHIIGALKDQADRVTLTSRAFHNERLGPFLQKLSQMSTFPKALVMNSGAEAVETGIKAARKWGYTVKGVPTDKAEIIVAADNFHGRTTTIISFSTEPQYREGFGPFTPGFVVVPFGDAAALEAAITPNTVAFLVEPIQAEAGILLPPAGYLRAVREICTQNRVLFFADEIQTGLGRAGHLFAWQSEDARPDCMALGKALGGGVLPISAFVATEEVMGVFRPGDHGSTFGGNPLAAAVGLAALEVIETEQLVARSSELGGYLLAQLRQLRSPHIREVRGQGLLIGVDIHRSSGRARPFCERLMERGVLCKETHDQVIRLAPPLIVEKDDLDWAISQFKAVLE